MISCESFGDRGYLRISGTAPNGAAIVSREVPGEVPYILRGGATTIAAGGFSLDDTEAPFGVPLTYRTQISGITVGDRLIQQNLALTPTFTHGVGGWVAGTGRTLAIESDPTAHSTMVGHFTGNAGGVAPAAPPTLIGHIDAAVYQSAAYTLTPPTTGGSAIATNDWMLIVHHQLASITAPATPSGWTLVDDTTNRGIRMLIWKRKRVGGDTGYTVTGIAGSQSIATLVWVRNALDEIIRTPDAVVTSPGTTGQLTSETITALRPRLSLMFHSAQMINAGLSPTATAVTGGATWQYTRVNGTDARTLVVSAFSSVDGGQTLSTTVSYSSVLDAGIAIGVVFQSTNDIAARTIARGKAAAMPADSQPYLLTGRFRFLTAGLRLWSQVKAVGTWAQVKAAYPTWLDVRGVASTVPGDFLKLFVTIVNPTDGTNYIEPVQVMASGEVSVNTWIDFSMLFTTATTIPSTAEIRFLHGSRLTEYAVDWYFDEVGITPGTQRATRDTLYWFSGDTPVPANPEDNLLPGGTWDKEASDSSIVWSGTVGNSVSVYTGPSAVSTTTTCWLTPDVEDYMPCAPVMISDPVNVSMAQWVGLVSIDNLEYTSRQAVHQVIGRRAPVVVTQARSWASGELTVLTNNLAQRQQLLTILASGRVVLFRMEGDEHPENNWYLSIGDVSEERPVPMSRVAARLFTLPFVRVERPTGMIEAASGATWQDVRDQGTWANLRSTHGNWLDVLLDVEDA